MIGVQSNEAADWLAVIRLIPIVITFCFGVHYKAPLVMLIAFCFGASVISNQFLENRLVAGLFATCSAYAIMYASAKLLTNRGKK